MRKQILFLFMFLSGICNSCKDDNSPGAVNSANTIIIITSTLITSVTTTTAISGGNVTSDGGSSIIERGVCYSTAINPSISNSHTIDGNGMGNYISNLGGLVAGTFYYVRAYATNSNGTVYGNQRTFTTSSGGVAVGGCVGGPSSITDFDGNIYNVIAIGNQCWMKENLKSSHFRNGDSIPNILDYSAWEFTYSEACSETGNNPSLSNTYGKLYNFYAVAKPSDLCPLGWHVPTNYEWNILVKYIDPAADTSCLSCSQSALAGGNMKEIGLANWSPPNIGATNSSGFTSVSGGMRSYDGTFYGFGIGEFYWSSYDLQNGNAICRKLLNNYRDIFSSSDKKNSGYSVRCIRD